MERKILNFNKPQKRFIINLLKTNSATSIWSRASGKSFIIAWLMHTIVRTMPRASWAIVGQSYKQIKTRTLPSTISGLEYIGYRKDIDYLVGKKPPAAWKWHRPFEPPLSYEHYIIFPNGTGFHFISQDGGGGSSRGLNIDGYMCDESLLLNKDKLDQEVSATNRGNLRHFNKIPIHHGVFHFSSMPYGSGAKWLVNQGNYYKDDGFDYKCIKENLVKIEIEFIKNKDPKYRLELWTKIVEIKSTLKYYAKNGRLYSESDIFDNIQNVGIKFIEQQYSDLTILMFLVEILNWHPDKVEDGFYPELSHEKHGYKSANNNSYLNNLKEDDSALTKPDSRMDADCISSLPLRIAIDWGAKINGMTIAQYYKSVNELRFLKNIYVKHPKILTDLAKDFCEYYKHHTNRDVIFIYDHTGNSSVANSKLTYAEQFAQILKRNNWNVFFATRGAAMSHTEKYLLWSKILKGNDPLMPQVMFNLDNCKETILSMSNAPIKEIGSGFEKNKSSERNPLIPQEEATHLSDTADMQVVSLFSSYLKHQSPYTGP